MNTTVLDAAPRPPRQRPPPVADAAAGTRRDAETELRAGYERATRWTVDAGGRRRADTALRLGGLRCAACAIPIEQALRAVDGVFAASVQAAAERATVQWDPGRTDITALAAAVRRVGYAVAPDTPAGARALRQAEARHSAWRLFVAAFCAMQVMMLATPAYVAGPGGLAPDLKHLLDWGAWVMSLPVMLFAAAPFYRGAWGALREHRIGMDVPVALGITVAFVASSIAAFAPQGPLGDAVYFDSLTMFVAFLLGGRALELRARHRAAESLEQALGALPETALRRRPDGGFERVDVARLRPGDEVRIAVGEGFPADGRVLEGATAIDESLLSGESRPRRKGPGDAVVAGSVNRDAPVRIAVERVGDDTRYAAIVALMREAQTQRPASARWADRWASPFLLAVLLLAAMGAAVWSFIDPARAVWVGVSVLVVTCPCALSLATPSALLAAAAGLARRGVLLVRLDALDALARCDHLFVDKTGTLTEDRLRYARMQRLDGAADPAGAAPPATATLLASAAALAMWSRHPLSQALAAAVAPDQRRRVPWRAVYEQPGAGLEALAADGTRWRLGRADWVRGVGGIGDPSGGEPAHAEAAGRPSDPEAAGLAAWFGPVGRPLARLQFEERTRAGAAAALAGLRADGVRVSLLSGDAPARVARLAAALGLDEACGGADPAAKRAALQQAQARGETVAMLGDGINDAPVLAQADIALAMGSGALLARTQADAVLLADRLDDVLQLRRTARRTLRVIRQNLAWAALYNAACVPLALAGLLPPWAAGLGMAASSLAVVGNSLRLSR